MKISYNWLKKYINTDLSAKRIGEILTDTGLEVEGLEPIEAVKGGMEGVVIGEVIDLKPHEDADKLKVATVDVGEGDPLQIVCGAPNIDKGQKVVVAKVGSTLYPQPDQPFKIKKAKIRGVASFGMICAEDELGLGESHAGIMVLDQNAEVGQQASEYFQLEDDTVLEIGLTPNRTDAMGHIGVARDLKAYLNFHHNSNIHLNVPDVPSIQDGKGVKINIESPELCPDYRMLTIEDVEVKPSPEWLAKSLRAIGIQPKNNIVDVTNFVMHECGHPLHAFDASVVGDEITIRNAKKGEKLLTLDELDRELHEDDLMIANRDEVMCIAGVMGGAKSGVKDSTTAVCIESAFFNPTTVRKSAKRHTIHSDASFRFERGANPEVLDWALKRAAQLILETAGGKLKGGIVVNNPQPFQPVKVKFDPNRCRVLIGCEISNEQMIQIFDDLGMMVQKKDEKWEMLIPGYRSEVTREADLVEEVLRIYGVNNITLPEQMKITPQASVGKRKKELRNRLAHRLTGAGWTEIMNNSLTSSQNTLRQGKWSEEQLVFIQNPLSIELDVLRPDLLSGGLQSLAYNINRKNDHLKFFEVGNTYQRNSEGKFIETKRLGLWFSAGDQVNNWNTQDENDFFVLKNALEEIGQICGLHFDFEHKNVTLLAKGVSIKANDKIIGEAGIVDPQIAQSFGVKKEVFFAELDWDYLTKKQLRKKMTVKELPTTLPVKRDFSLLVDAQISFSEIKHAVTSNYKGSLLREIQLFDVYEGDKLPSGKKSYALSFVLQDDQKTLKDQAIDKQMAVIRNILEEKVGAELR